MLPASDIAWMSAIVAASLDATVMRYRDTTSPDGQGHSTITPDVTGLAVKCNVIKPSATQLQAFASIIGSQWAMILRVMQTADIRECDRIVYNGVTWKIQNVQNAESYTMTKELLMTAVV